MEKNILILVGKGKLNLTYFMRRVSNYNLRVANYSKINEILENDDKIKEDCAYGVYSIIQLKKQEDLKKINAGIRRRALIFNIDIIR